MITWRELGTEWHQADVRAHGSCIARLHARPNRWQVELIDGSFGGPAGSMGHAKRAALEGVADALADVLIEVRAAAQVG